MCLTYFIYTAISALVLEWTKLFGDCIIDLEKLLILSTEVLQLKQNVMAFLTELGYSIVHNVWSSSKNKLTKYVKH